VEKEHLKQQLTQDLKKAYAYNEEFNFIPAKLITNQSRVLDFRV